LDKPDRLLCYASFCTVGYLATKLSVSWIISKTVSWVQKGIPCGKNSDDGTCAYGNPQLTHMYMFTNVHSTCIQSDCLIIKSVNDCIWVSANLNHWVRHICNMVAAQQLISIKDHHPRCANRTRTSCHCLHFYKDAFSVNMSHLQTIQHPARLGDTFIVINRNTEWSEASYIYRQEDALWNECR